MRLFFVWILGIIISASGCHQPSPVIEATQSGTLLLQHDAQALKIPLLERQRLSRLPQIQWTQRCTFVIDSDMDIRQKSPVFMIERSVAYEQTTTHLTAISIKSVNAQGCRLSATSHTQPHVSYLSMGSADHSISWMRVPVTLSYQCPKHQGSDVLTFRGDHIVSGRVMCEDDQMMFLEPDTQRDTAQDQLSQRGERDCKTPHIDQVCMGQFCKSLGRCAYLNMECQATEDAHCAQSSSCETRGYCTAHQGRCKAMRDQDCAQSLSCRVFGRCSAVDGACVIQKDEDCARNTECKMWGLCSAVDGQCVAHQDQDCADSDMCKVWGLCSAVKGKCAAKKNEDCRPSNVCHEHKACFAVDGACVRK